MTDGLQLTHSNYANIVVHVDISRAAPARVELAGKLARRFGARVIGVASEEPFTAFLREGFVAPSDQVADEERRRVAKDLATAEAAFRGAVGKDNIVEWRAGEVAATVYLLEQARAADLVVVGRAGSDDELDWRLGVTPADIVLSLGRPMLLVPPTVNDLSAKRVVIGWKETREARRAIWDSLPLLRRATKAIVVTVGSQIDLRSAADVGVYLENHGVAETRTIHCGYETGVVSQLLSVADSEGADLIVAGAYGHNRLREWILGGVTQELLATTPACCLLSH